MKKDIIVKNYSNFKGCLIKLVGEELAEKLIESLGGDENIANGSFSTTDDTGSAEDGSLVKNIMRLTKIARGINEVLPEDLRADQNSLNKVCFLSHIAKAIMYEPNDSSWDVTNRGILYKFTELEGALRCGERSALICLRNGIDFTEEEFEAMRINDMREDDNYAKYYASTISVVLRQANELLRLQNKLEVEKKKKEQ